VPIAMRIVGDWQKLKAKRLMARAAVKDDERAGSL
jgi:hypothetical protein